MSWPGDISSLYAEGILERDSNMLPQPGDDVFQPNLNSIYEGNRHRTSVSSSSGSSICEPSSPSTAYLRRQSTSGYSITGPDDEAGDAPWNLVAYHIPWGPGYEGYEAGTLPGPDGTCIFLRSPTPLKRQRTTQACDKCRERKAKVKIISNFGYPSFWRVMNISVFGYKAYLRSLFWTRFSMRLLRWSSHRKSWFPYQSSTKALIFKFQRAVKNFNQESHSPKIFSDRCNHSVQQDTWNPASTAFSTCHVGSCSDYTNSLHDSRPTSYRRDAWSSQ